MKTHPFDAVSFIFGVLFVALGALFVAASRPWLALLDIQWSWIPAVLAILIGGALLARLVRPDAEDGAVERTAETEQGSELIAAHETLETEVPRTDDL